MRRVAQRTSPIWNFLVKSMPSPARSLVAPRRSSCSSKGLRSLGPHPWTSPICPAKHFSIASRLPEHVEIPMPKLVPSMTSGRLVEWFVSPGDPLCAGDLLCEVQVTGLLEEAPEADTSLLIESHEVGFFAKALVHVDANVLVDHPIGLIVENEEDVDKFESYEPAHGPSKNSGGASERTERLFCWQAYVKD